VVSIKILSAKEGCAVKNTSGARLTFNRNMMKKTILLLVLAVTSVNSFAERCFSSGQLNLLDDHGEVESRLVTRIDGQLYYQSTGINSRYKNMYFPFYGLEFINSQEGRNAGVWIKKTRTDNNTIWSTYMTNNTFFNWSDELWKDPASRFIETEIRNSEIPYRLGGIDTARTSYRIYELPNSAMNQNWGPIYRGNPFIEELYYIFHDVEQIQQDYLVSPVAGINFSEVGNEPANKQSIVNEFNNYVQNSQNSWEINCPDIE
jgi:hypothetical protein